MRQPHFKQEHQQKDFRQPPQQSYPDSRQQTRQESQEPQPPQFNQQQSAQPQFNHHNAQPTPQPASQPTPQPHQQTPPPAKLSGLEKIQTIQKNVRELMDIIEKFSGKPKDREYLYLDEMLTRNLISLDQIEVEGKDNIRQARREAIKCIEKLCGILEAKAKANEGIEAMEVEKSDSSPKLNEENKQAESESEVKPESNTQQTKTNSSSNLIASEQQHAADTKPTLEVSGVARTGSVSNVPKPEGAESTEGKTSGAETKGAENQATVNQAEASTETSAKESTKCDDTKDATDNKEAKDHSDDNATPMDVETAKESQNEGEKKKAKKKEKPEKK